MRLKNSFSSSPSQKGKKKKQFALGIRSRCYFFLPHLRFVPQCYNLDARVVSNEHHLRYIFSTRIFS